MSGRPGLKEDQMSRIPYFFVSVLTLVVSACFGQNFDGLQSAHQQLTVFHQGKATADVTTSATLSPLNLFIWSERKYYAPGEEIRIRAVGLTGAATNLVISITDAFTSLGSSSPTYTVTDACDCGDGNGGFVPSLANYNFLTLWSRKVPTAQFGRHDLTVSVFKQDLGIQLQTTHLTVFTLAATSREVNPIVIDTLQPGYVKGSGAVVTLTGTFPVNVPIYFFVGEAPYEGVSGSSAISKDGTTLILPATYGNLYESRAILMTQDGSFSTISQSFLPFLNPPLPPGQQ